MEEKQNIEIMRGVLGEIYRIKKVIARPNICNETKTKDQAQINIQACIFIDTAFLIIGHNLKKYKHPTPTTKCCTARNCSRLVSLIFSAIAGFREHPKPKFPPLYNPLVSIVEQLTNSVLYALEVYEHRQTTSRFQKELQQYYNIVNDYGLSQSAINDTH